MLRSLTTGISGMQNLQSRLDIIGNNVANANTTAYKANRLDFAEAFTQTLTGGSSGNTPAQVGTGVAVSSLKTDYQDGTLAPTNREEDLGIDGAGFFVVRDSVTGTEYLTRAGNFEVKNGYLQTADGLRVQGFTDPGLTTRGDVRIDNNGGAIAMKSFHVAEDGRVLVFLADGTELVRGQVLLQQVATPGALYHEGNSLFSLTADAGAAPTLQAPGTAGLGKIEAKSLEMSNVNLTGEFLDLISTQRGFQANARIVTTSDEILQEVINLKR